MHERHILIQLLLRLLRHSRSRKGTFILFFRRLQKARLLPSLRKKLFESGYSVLRSIILSRRHHLLAQHLIPMRQDRFDEFPCVSAGIEQRNWGVRGHWECDFPGVLGRKLTHHAAGDIGHEETGHEKCGGNGERADVSFDGGFGVEVLDVRVGAVSELIDVHKGGPDEMLDAGFLHQEMVLVNDETAVGSYLGIMQTFETSAIVFPCLISSSASIFSQ